MTIAHAPAGKDRAAIGREIVARTTDGAQGDESVTDLHDSMTNATPASAQTAPCAAFVWLAMLTFVVACYPWMVRSLGASETRWVEAAAGEGAPAHSTVAAPSVRPLPTASQSPAFAWAVRHANRWLGSGPFPARLPTLVGMLIAAWIAASMAGRIGREVGAAWLGPLTAVVFLANPLVVRVAAIVGPHDGIPAAAVMLWVWALHSVLTRSAGRISANVSLALAAGVVATTNFGVAVSTLFATGVYLLIHRTPPDSSERSRSSAVVCIGVPALVTIGVALGIRSSDGNFKTGPWDAFAATIRTDAWPRIQTAFSSGGAWSEGLVAAFPALRTSLPWITVPFALAVVCALPSAIIGRRAPAAVRIAAYVAVFGGICRAVVGATDSGGGQPHGLAPMLAPAAIVVCWLVTNLGSGRSLACAASLGALAALIGLAQTRVPVLWSVDRTAVDHSWPASIICIAGAFALALVARLLSERVPAGLSAVLLGASLALGAAQIGHDLEADDAAADVEMVVSLNIDADAQQTSVASTVAEMGAEPR